jgi:hypothetical protein
MRIIYESSDSNLSDHQRIVDVTGTNRVAIIEGFRAGNVIVTARSVCGRLSDQLLVNVRHIDNTQIRYIVSDSNLVMMNTNEEPLHYSARIMGRRDNGTSFEPHDSDHLQWNLFPATSNVMRIDGIQSGMNVVGASVMLVPLNAGNVELQIRHPEVPGYVKSVFVQVSVDHVVFRLEPIYKIVQPGDPPFMIEAVIQNVPDLDFARDLRWEVINNIYEDAQGDLFHAIRPREEVFLGAGNENRFLVWPNIQGGNHVLYW